VLTTSSASPASKSYAQIGQRPGMAQVLHIPLRDLAQDTAALILPLRVLGSAGADRSTSGVAIGPISVLTLRTSCSRSASLSSVPEGPTGCRVRR
jgi:hypothetical protein